MARDRAARLLVATALLCQLPGCARDAEDGPGPDPPGRTGGSLRLDAPQLDQLRSLDPVRVTDVNSGSVAAAIYEGLLGYSPDSPGHLVPLLASWWETSEEGRVWTFGLRDGVRFHDDPCFEGGRGRPVTVEDVRDSIVRSLREGERAAPLSLRDLIEGAGDLGGGPSGEVPGIEIVDETTIRFRIVRASDAFPHALATSAGWVVPWEALRRYGAGFGHHPVGTGPFRLAGWNTETMVLVRNDHYWRTDADGRRLPYLDSIVMRRGEFSGRRRTVLSALLDGSLHAVYFTGELDWAEFGRLSEFMGDRGVGTVRTPKLNTIFYGWNMARDNVWTRHPELRRAVFHAVNRPAPTDLMEPASGLLPPGLTECAATEPARRDPRRARELLREAGFPGGRGLPPLRIGAVGRTEYLLRNVLEPLEEVGIETDVRVTPWDLHWEALERGEYEFFRDGWIADYPDPGNFYQLFYSGSAMNHTRYSDPTYDRLFERFQALPADSPERRRICARLEAILRRDCPAVFLYHERSVYLVRREVRNVDAFVNPFERKFYELVWLDRGARP
ncbi:MAG: ABC transporter substrate-binding protein [Acidobacteriota bacterium]